MNYSEQYAKAKETGQTKYVSARLHTWEIDKPLIGKYLESEEMKSTKKGLPDFKRYLFDTDEGHVVFLGSQAFDKSSGARLEQDHVYCITFRGKKKISEGRTYNVFDVEEVVGTDVTA